MVEPLRIFPRHAHLYEARDVPAGLGEAETGLRLPDSIIVSSGLKEGVDLIATHDKGFKAAGEYIESATPEEIVQGLE